MPGWASRYSQLDSNRHGKSSRVAPGLMRPMTRHPIVELDNAAQTEVARALAMVVDEDPIDAAYGAAGNLPAAL
jgi:hypothetical protein